MAYANKVIESDSSVVTRLYDFRTAEEYATYLLPYLKPNFKILDVGSGPGGITRDLAKLVPEGNVIGIDVSSGVVEQARSKYQEPNLSYQVGDAANLAQFEDNSFDVVHAHCVIMHVVDRVKVMKEMHRVVKPGGIVASRDPGAGMVAVKPERPPFTRLLTEFEPVVMRFIDSIGSCYQAGLYKRAWAVEAGFGEQAGGRILELKSYERTKDQMNLFRYAVGDKVVEMGLASAEQVKEWKSIWDEWDKIDEREAVREFVDMLCFKAGEGSSSSNGQGTQTTISV
ncbi:unnamed protein product [Discula destructiva]